LVLYGKRDVLNKTPQPSLNKKTLKTRPSGLRGFTLQLFLFIVLPLTILVLVVAFGSQSLHHEAMRSLVGDRDLKTVQAAASTLEREISHVGSTIQILSRNLEGKTNFNSLILTPDEIATTFDGGLALFANDGSLIRSSSSKVDWITLPKQIPGSFGSDKKSDTPQFSTLINSGVDSNAYIFVSVITAQKEILVGAFSPGQMINESIGSLSNSGQTTVMVISSSGVKGKFDVLYHGGPIKIDESLPTHPGIEDVLNGESGINYFQSSEGEHVVAFSPIQNTGWGLIIEEAWEDIANPNLVNTQAAPLILVPVFLLALLAIWFGARRIVTPLQKLEKQASNLAAGDFDSINQPVGGIEEIRNLQAELIEMAEKLKTAQQTLHNYIGAITAGVESERKSLARELHDDTIQALIALNQRIQLALLNTPKPQSSPMSELQTLVQQTMTNLRRMIRGLRPIYLEDLGLVASLEMLVHEMEQSSNLPIAFSSKGQELRLDAKSEMSIYRMVQESLNNVIHHASAAHAWVELDFSENRLIVMIRDDGKGFVVSGNPVEFPEKGHFGLLGLSERAELIDAELEINSILGKGTTILIKMAKPNAQ
jgi:signal transduction histidine kinase